MFSLPFFIYALLVTIGLGLLAAAKVTARAQADGAPLGGQVGISIAVRAIMLSLGVTLVISGVVFGFPSVVGVVRSALDFLR